MDERKQFCDPSKKIKRKPLKSLHSTLISILLLASVLVSLATAAQTKKIIVAKDGTGRYKTVQAAFDAVPLGNKKPVVIFIRNGIYQEKLHLDSSKNKVTLIGEDKFKTILTYNDHSGKISPSGATINTHTSESFLIKANEFTAENITFQNDAGFSAGQAVAVQVAGDRAIFLNCRFLGFQDVLFTSSPASRQYYEHCYIEGTTDFIFGSSTAWFQQCHIHSKKNSHVTAASTPKETPYGYVFNDCVLTADTALQNVSLGRPWQPYASVTYLNTYIDRHITAKGWDNWKKPENEKTARYAEYNSYGPGAHRDKRVAWIKQLTDEEARKYTLKNVFPTWNPTIK
jgi:pectinesterase